MNRSRLALALALAFALSPARTAAAPVPDEPLVDQDGRALRLYSDVMKGRVVAVSFIFTTCTTICSPMTAVLARVQDRLGARLGKDVALVSITLDPEHDDPARLKAFADKFRRRPGWTFLTGEPDRVRRALRALGAKDGPKEAHAPILLVGDPAAGRWKRLSGFAPPQQIVEEIEASARRAGAVSRGEGAR
jgi:protein SCO1/2